MSMLEGNHEAKERQTSYVSHTNKFRGMMTLADSKFIEHLGTALGGS